MINNGKLKAYVSRRLVTRTNLLLAVGLVLFGVLASLLLPRPSLPAYCASGEITLSGATTFGPQVIKQIADHYQQQCPDATITFPNVSAKGSEDGLRMVNNGQITVGISNISATVSPQYANLVDHKDDPFAHDVIARSSFISDLTSINKDVLEKHT